MQQLAQLLTPARTLCLAPGISRKATERADLVVAWLADSRLSWLALTLPTAACLWFMNDWGMDTPDKSLSPHWPVLIVYMGFFNLGWLLHRQEGLIEQLTRLTKERFVLAVASIMVTVVLSSYQTDKGHPWFEWIGAGFAFS